jgi:hypothetical protein
MINCLLFFSPKIHIFSVLFLSFSFSSLFPPSLLPHVQFLLMYRAQDSNSSWGQAAPSSPSPWCPLAAPMPPPSCAPSPPPPNPSFPSPVSSPWPAMELQLRPWLPFYGESHTSSFFLVGWPKQVHMTTILQSPSSILSETNSNLRILWDFIFQLNTILSLTRILKPPDSSHTPI